MSSQVLRDIVTLLNLLVAQKTLPTPVQAAMDRLRESAEKLEKAIETGPAE